MFSFDYNSEPFEVHLKWNRQNNEYKVEHVPIRNFNLCQCVFYFSIRSRCRPRSKSVSNEWRIQFAPMSKSVIYSLYNFFCCISPSMNIIQRYQLFYSLVASVRASRKLERAELERLSELKMYYFEHGTCKSNKTCFAFPHNSTSRRPALPHQAIIV